MTKRASAKRGELPRYRSFHPGTQPEYNYPPYASTQKRCPTQPLVVAPQTLSELTGPVFGYGDIKPTEPGDGLVHEILYVALVTNVGANEFGRSAECAKLRDQCLTGVIAATGDDEIGAFFGEGECGGAADTGQGASDEDNRTGHVSSPSKVGRYAR